MTNREVERLVDVHFKRYWFTPGVRIVYVTSYRRKLLPRCWRSLAVARFLWKTFCFVVRCLEYQYSQRNRVRGGTTKYVFRVWCLPHSFADHGTARTPQCTRGGRRAPKHKRLTRPISFEYLRISYTRVLNGTSSFFLKIFFFLNWIFV